MEKDLLSTTELAKLLSVTPDTVLKWVRAGKIKSYRTPGGHSRIPRTEVETLLPKQVNDVPHPKIQRSSSRQYCWEFLANGGPIKDKCKQCITYRSRAKRCYELRELPDGMGCLRMFCESSCEDCDYFQLMKGKKLNVLFISKSKMLVKDRDKINNSKIFHAKFVDNEYECSKIIEQFRPDYIVVDVSFGKERTVAFCNSIFNDFRIPVARIVVASKNREIEEYCDKEIFGWIKKPFTVKELTDYVKEVSSSNGS